MLNKTQRIILAIVVIIVVIIGLAYILNKYTGWQNFSMKKGENFQMTNIDSTEISKLKFRSCIFTTTGKDGTTKTANVTSVLNGMVAAYDGNTNKNYIFKLDDPGLSPYSFQLPGFNDKDNHPDTANWQFELPETKATLTGYYKLLK